MPQNLRHNFPYTLTADQLEALRNLEVFLMHPDARRIFVLRGYAGTGKTTLLAHVSRQLKGKVELLAPTGRAARVLAAYCGQMAYTIHKRIYRLEETGGGDPVFKLRKNTLTNTLFIVDEASMIASGEGYGRDLLVDLMRFVYRGKGCSLMLSGDTAQLPPVGFETSPALNDKYLKNRFQLPVISVELEEVLRQSLESGVLYNATKIRRLIAEENTNVSIELSGFEDIQAIEGQLMQEYLEDSFSGRGLEDVLIITRSNKRANLFNAEVRNRLLFREYEIDAGDMMMVVKNNYFWLKSEKDAFIANGETCEILQITQREEKYGFQFANARVRLTDNRFEDVEVKLWLDAINAEAPSVSQVKVKELYHAVLNEYRLNPGEFPPKEMVENDPYFNALQVKFSYAVTCHKSQGGQWEVVFIDQGYLTDEMVDVSWMRWLYTALTRAQKKVYLVNFNSQFLDTENDAI